MSEGRAATLVALASSAALAQEGFVIELLTGSALNLPSRLSVELDDGRAISESVDFRTGAFEGAPYYALRIGRLQSGRAWELELLHHKLYLADPPAPLRSFEITHGYNMLLVNRAWPWRSFALRVGVGAVVPHAELALLGETIRQSGYRLGGPALQAGASWRYPRDRPLFFQAEIKATLSSARTDVEGIDVEVRHGAIHGLMGVGYRFGKARPAS